MPASSILVNTAESAELRLVHLLGDHDATSPFVLTCEECIANADAANLLQTIVDQPSAWTILMEGLADVDEAVGAFSLLAALLDRVPDHATSTLIMKGMVSHVESYQSETNAAAADGDDDNAKGENGRKASLALVEQKLGMLCALYNLREPSKDKCWLLGRILTLAAYSNHQDVQIGLLPGRGTTLGALLECKNLTRLVEKDFTAAGGAHDDNGQGVGETDKRLLYSVASDVIGQVANVCRASGGTLDKEVDIAISVQQTYLLKLLETYSSVSEVDGEALAAAKAAATGAIRDPVTLFHEQRGIMSLPPILALEADAATKPLYSLLQIFQEGKLEDFQAFLSKNESTLSECGLDKEECIRHMRLLSLCSLATEHEEIPYGAIATTLQVQPSEVESWVISAVSSGLLSAKMDQLQQVVMVERCVVRRFGMEQWRMLQTRLNTWKSNVSAVLEGLKQSQAAQQ